MAWNQTNGLAMDIGVNGDGTIWVIGTIPSPPFGWSIHRSRDNGENWEQMPGAGTRISVDRDGNAWVVNALGGVYRWNGNTFIQQNAPAALDIAAGIGTVYLIGKTPVDPFGYQIFWRYFDQGNFALMPGGAIRVAAKIEGAGALLELHDTPYVVNQEGQIFKWNGNTFIAIPGGVLATDIAASQLNDNIIYVTTQTPVVPAGIQSGFTIAKYNGDLPEPWEVLDGAGSNISCGSDNTPWVTNMQHGIFSRV